MTYHEDLAAAEAILRAAENGDYDEALGITTEHRALLDRAQGDEPLTDTDIKALDALQRHDLIAAAYDAGRITFTSEENQ